MHETGGMKTQTGHEPMRTGWPWLRQAALPLTVASLRRYRADYAHTPLAPIERNLYLPSFALPWDLAVIKCPSFASPRSSPTTDQPSQFNAVGALATGGFFTEFIARVYILAAVLQVCLGAKMDIPFQPRHRHGNGLCIPLATI